VPTPRTSARRLALALSLYAAVTALCLLTTAPERLARHTPYNHFALLADAWLHGRLDLGGPPPAYAQNNDFATFHERTFISFPPFPAVLIAPYVKLAGSAEATRDGLFFGLFAGVGPAFLFLALDKLSRTGRSRRTTFENAALAALFAAGTVYWSTAVQGTVWFVAHVVGVALTCIYLWASLDAAHPVIAGLALACGFATRTSMGFAFPLFLYEAYRVSSRADGPVRVGRADLRTLAERLAMFALPVGFVLAAVFWHNRARFGDPYEFGHRYLAVHWQPRIQKWGLESYHYLGRNLAVLLTSLPYTKVPGAPFQINAHGLALWITSPFYAWALWPKRTGATFWALALTALSVAAPSLLYQNSGWIQFGQRFSNDYAPFLIALVALGGRRLTPPFWVCALAAVAVNGFGALTFQRGAFARYYFVDGTQKILHQPD
jgi:hypothetical protein